jgi:four helix bundle protein
MIESFRDLRIWQKSMQMNEACHRIILLLPKSERFEIGSQLRRSGISVSANIAEGFGQATCRSYLHYLAIAQGSLNETETHLELIKRIAIVRNECVGEALKFSDETGRMLTALRLSLKNQAPDVEKTQDIPELNARVLTPNP